MRNGWTIKSKNFLGVSKAKKNKRKREKGREKGRPLGKYPSQFYQGVNVRKYHVPSQR